MSKREQLEKNVVDTKAAYADAWAAADDAWDDIEIAAFDAWVKAKRELASYLKEQDDD